MADRVKSSLPKRKKYLAKSSVGVRKVNPKRRAKEWARAYGSKERVRFVAALPCCVTSAEHTPGESENHHIENGGKSRRADARFIVPLCRLHHRVLHDCGRQTFERAFCTNLKRVAADTEKAWQEYLLSGFEESA